MLERNNDRLYVLFTRSPTAFFALRSQTRVIPSRQIYASRILTLENSSRRCALVKMFRNNLPRIISTHLQRYLYVIVSLQKKLIYLCEIGKYRSVKGLICIRLNRRKFRLHARDNVTQEMKQRSKLTKKSLSSRQRSVRSRPRKMRFRPIGRGLVT